MAEAVTLYELIVNGEPKFMPFREASQMYDSGQVPVSFGTCVIENNQQRDMTDDEKRRISNFADELSAMK